MREDKKMIHAVTHFSSHSYQPIIWRDIFQQACKAVSAAVPISGLVNKNNYVLLVRSDYCNSIALLDNHEGLLSVSRAELLNIECKFLHHHELDFYHLKNKNDGIQKKHADIYYPLFLGALSKEIKTACQKILLYTQEHLSNRYYHDIKLSQLDVVHAEIADIIILLSKISMCSLHHIDDIHFVLSQYVIILKLLSRLSGARAVLKGNALELLFYLNFFLQFSKEM